MQFALIDRIVELEPGRRIVAIKNLTLGEEYLQDHFPGFPILPGVLMLEAMVQAGAWLVRVSDSFAHSLVTLGTVRACRYGNFVRPGDSLRVEVELKKLDGDTASLKGTGTVGGQTAVSGRFTMQCANLSRREPELGELDQRIVSGLKGQFRQIVAESGLSELRRLAQ